MRTTSTILLLAAAIASSALCDDGDFQWQGQLAPAQLLEIRGALGSIRAEGTSDGTASVTARKTATAGDPATVSIQVTPSEGGVVICAMYPDGMRASRTPVMRPVWTVIRASITTLTCRWMGADGRSLRLSTLNGNIVLRRGAAAGQ
jgi:hypothetical protein